MSDPDHQLLHRGLRTAIGQFSLMLFGYFVVDNLTYTLFAAFGAFSVLGLAELGGRRRARPRAYAGLAVASAVGIAAGTLASENVVAGAAVMLVGVFALQFATVFGGYVAATEPAVLLAFVLGLMVPGRPADIVARELGWLSACALGTVLALVLWPPPDSRVIADAYAQVCRSIAGVVRAVAARARGDEGGTARPGSEPDATVADVVAQLRHTRELMLTQPTRPAGPTEHDQALHILMDELNRTITALDRLDAEATSGPSPLAPAQRALSEVVASAFDASAEGLERCEPPRITPLEVDRARDQHVHALTDWIEHEVAQGADPSTILVTTRRVFPLRVLSMSAVSINANVSILGGEAVDTDPLETVPRVPGGSSAEATGRRARRILADHLHPGSVWFRNSARAAVSLALALCVAQIGGFNHGFWIVLGALSVLRSNALGTSRTAFQAIFGNLLGFAAAALILTIAGDRTVILWAVLPIAIFLSAYTPQAVHFVIGQASFGLLVVVLFNLLTPLGLVTGVERVQNVMIGAGLSVVIAFLFWPRGAGAALRDTLATLYRADAAFLAGAVRDMLGTDPRPALTSAATGSPVDDLRRRQHALDAARRQSNAAYATYLNERGSKRMEREDWGAMFGAATGVRLAGDSIEQLAGFGFAGDALASPAVAAAHAALHAAWRQRIATLGGFADALTPPRRGSQTPAGTDPDPIPIHADAAPASDLDAVVAQALQDASDPGDLRPTLGLVFLTAWLGVVDHLTTTVRAPVARAEQTNARPWYR